MAIAIAAGWEWTRWLTSRSRFPPAPASSREPRTALPSRSIRSSAGRMRLWRNSRCRGRLALPPRSACSARASSAPASAILKLFQLVSPVARLRIVL